MLIGDPNLGFVQGAQGGADPNWLGLDFVASTSISTTTTFSRSYPKDIFWKPDGTRFFLLYADTGNSTAISDNLREYSCSTPWNIAGATLQRLKNTAGLPVTNTRDAGLHFSPDGTKVYIANRLTKIIYCYSLSVAWNIESTWTLHSQSSALYSNPWGFHLSPDGTKLFVVYGTPNIYEYTLATPWNLSTIVGGTYTNVAALGGSQACYGFTLSPDGKQGVWCCSRYDDIGGLYSFTLPTAWSLTGLVRNNVTHVPSFVVALGLGNGFFMNDDASRFYATDGATYLGQYNKI